MPFEQLSEMQKKALLFLLAEGGTLVAKIKDNNEKLGLFLLIVQHIPFARDLIGFILSAPVQDDSVLNYAIEQISDLKSRTIFEALLQASVEHQGEMEQKSQELIKSAEDMIEQLDKGSTKTKFLPQKKFSTLKKKIKKLPEPKRLDALASTKAIKQPPSTTNTPQVAHVKQRERVKSDTAVCSKRKIEFPKKRTSLH